MKNPKESLIIIRTKETELFFPSKETVIFPSDKFNFSLEGLGYKLAKTDYILMDRPEMQESLYNMEVVSTNSKYTLVSIIYEGEKRFALFHGKAECSEEYASFLREFDKAAIIKPQDKEKIGLAAKDYKLAVVNDHDDGLLLVRPDQKSSSKWQSLANSFLNDYHGSQHFSLHFWRDSMRTHVLVESLSSEQILSIKSRSSYASAINITFNINGDILISGGGNLSKRSIGSRSGISSAFLFILKRNDHSLGIIKFLQSEKVDEKEKRELLSELLQAIEPSFPESINGQALDRDLFTDEEKVELIITSGISKPRASFKNEQLVNEPQKMTEEKTEFIITDLEEAVLAAGQYREMGFNKLIKILFDYKGKKIDFSNVRSTFLAELVKTIRQRNIEGYKLIGRDIATLQSRIQEYDVGLAKKKGLDGTSVFNLELNNLSEDEWLLLTSIKQPDTLSDDSTNPTKEKDMYYFDRHDKLYMFPVPKKGRVTNTRKLTVNIKDIGPLKRDLGEIECTHLRINQSIELPIDISLSTSIRSVFIESNGDKTNSSLFNSIRSVFVEDSNEQVLLNNLKKLFSNQGLVTKNSTRFLVYLDERLEKTVSKMSLNLPSDNSYKTIFFTDISLAKKFKKRNENLVVYAEGEGWPI